MAKLGDRVIYRVHQGHHTTIEEQVHDLVEGKRVARFEEYADPVFKLDGDKKIPVLDAKGQQVTETKKRPVMRTVAFGSVHHPEMRELLGIVGRCRSMPRTAERDAYAAYDVLLLPPNRAPVWVDAVEEGSGAHAITVIEGDEVDHEALLDRLEALEHPGNKPAQAAAAE